MARRINKVQLIALTVLSVVVQSDALRLDGDSPFTLYIKRIEYLGIHLAFFQTATVLYEPVRQRRLTMINVGNDGEITNMAKIRHDTVGAGGLVLRVIWKIGGKST